MSNIPLRLILLSFFLFLAGCGGGSGSASGTPITQQMIEEAGENCAAGGWLVLSGIDRNNDGILYDNSQNEIDDYHYECNATRWSVPQKLVVQNTSAELQDMLVMNNGDRMLFYKESDVYRAAYTYKMNYYVSAIGQTRTLNAPGASKYAMDRSGHAVGVWTVRDNVTALTSAWASRFDVTNGWKAAEKIAQTTVADPYGLDPFNLNVVMLDELDSSMVVARYDDTHGSRMHGVTHAGWGNWILPAMIDKDFGYIVNSSMPKIARDGNGNVFATWYQAGRIYVNRFTYFNNDVWDGYYPVDSGLGNISQRTRGVGSNIVVSNAGKAFVYWRETNNGSDEFWGVFYRPSTGWGSAFKIDKIQDADFYDESAAFDGDGNVLIGWLESDANTRRIWVSKITDETTISHAQLYEHELVNLYFSKIEHPKIATDLYGNAVVVWYGSPVRVSPVDYQSSGSIWTLFFDTTAGTWSNPEVINLVSGNFPGDFIVKMFGNGKVIMSMETSDVSLNYSLWTSQMDVNGVQ